MFGSRMLESTKSRFIFNWGGDLAAAIGLLFRGKAAVASKLIESRDWLVMGFRVTDLSN